MLRVSIDPGLTEACAQVAGAAGVYCPHLDTLVINFYEIPIVDPEIRSDFDHFGPFLAGFTSLTHLDLSGWPLPPESTAGWPKLRCQLSSFTLIITWLQIGYPSAADFDWLTYSSHGSLREMFLGGCGADVLSSVAEWGHNLRLLTVVVIGEDLDGDFGLITSLASLPKLEQLRVIIPKRAEGTETDEPAIRAAVGTANEQLGREAAVVIDDDSYDNDWI